LAVKSSQIRSSQAFSSAHSSSLNPWSGENMRAGRIVPTRPFNTFPIPAGSSLNYRYADGWFYKLDATTGVVAFHKATGEGDRWSIRTMYPRPPLLKDLGDLTKIPRTRSHAASKEPKEPKEEKAEKKKTKVAASSSQAKVFKRSKQRNPTKRKNPRGRATQPPVLDDDEGSSSSSEG
jgi:hypothetical protein